MTNPICKSMRSTITSILKAHHLFSRFDAANDFHVKIENAPYMPLVIEKHGTQIVVAHYFLQNGDLVPDPDMEFQIGPDREWYPVAIQFAIGAYRRCVRETEDGRTLVNLRERQSQKSFSNKWARNLKEQGFDRGTILKTKED